MPWGRGRPAIERLIEHGELETVHPSDDLARRLLGEATSHVQSAELIQEVDPPGGFQLAYDAARKACSALLAVQGLRATTGGGHRAVQEAVVEQFGPVFGAYGSLRRQRQGSEYPDLETPTVDSGDAAFGIRESRAIVEAAKKLLESGELSVFR